MKKTITKAIEAEGLKVPNSWSKKRFLTPSISTMSGKLAGIRGLSVDPLTDSFCRSMDRFGREHICKVCYSKTMVRSSRKNCRPAWITNGVLMNRTILPLENVPVLPDDIFRFAPHGSISTMRGMCNIRSFCNKNPETYFVLWTKDQKLVKRFFDLFKKPENLRIIYSVPVIDSRESLPKYCDKAFRVISKNSAETPNCVGKCRACMKCYDPSNAETDIVERVK